MGGAQWMRSAPRMRLICAGLVGADRSCEHRKSWCEEATGAPDLSLCSTRGTATTQRHIPRRPSRRSNDHRHPLGRGSTACRVAGTLPRGKVNCAAWEIASGHGNAKVVSYGLFGAANRHRVTGHAIRAGSKERAQHTRHGPAGSAAVMATTPCRHRGTLRALIDLLPSCSGGIEPSRTIR